MVQRNPLCCIFGLLIELRARGQGQAKTTRQSTRPLQLHIDCKHLF